MPPVTKMWLDFIVAIVTHLAWPALILIGLHIFRSELRDLLRALINKIRTIRSLDVRTAAVHFEASDLLPPQERVIREVSIKSLSKD